MSQTWLLLAAEKGGCCSVVQMHLYAMIPGELCSTGISGKGWWGLGLAAVQFWWGWGVEATVAEWGRTGSQTQQWNLGTEEAGWTHEPDAQQANYLILFMWSQCCVTWISSWCFAAEGNTWMKIRLGIQSDAGAPQLLLLGAGITCKWRCKYCCLWW